MSKRILLIAMMCCVNILLHAQQAVGQWQLYPTKSTVAGIVYESNGDEVYYMSGSNLFSYDKMDFSHIRFFIFFKVFVEIQK